MVCHGEPLFRVRCGLGLPSADPPTRCSCRGRGFSPVSIGGIFAFEPSLHDIRSWERFESGIGDSTAMVWHPHRQETSSMDQVYEKLGAFYLGKIQDHTTRTMSDYLLYD